MAMGVGGAGTGRRPRRLPMSDINVTPLVDVMLVLLIIFMVTAPLLIAGVPVDLPQSKAKAVEDLDEPITVSMDAAGLLYIDEEQLTAEDFPERLAVLARMRPGARVLVRADRSLEYGAVLQLMGEIAASGFTKVALISQPGGRTPR